MKRYFGILCLVLVLGVAGTCSADLLDYTYDYTLGGSTVIFDRADASHTKLTDGITYAVWNSSGGYDVQWRFSGDGNIYINIDLGDTYNIDDVNIHTVIGPRYGIIAPHLVDIDGSTNGSDWSDIDSWNNPVMNASSPVNANYEWQGTGQLTDVTARYLKVWLRNSAYDANYNRYFNIDQLTVNGTAIPEPATMALLVSGGVVGLLRRKRK